jgi:hypothetical protein
MPAAIAARYETEALRLFDEVYAKVRGDAVTYRRLEKGMRVADAQGRLVALDDETYVARMIRAVRNASHGLLEIVREHDDRYLLATNSGAIPPEFPALARDDQDCPGRRRRRPHRRQHAPTADWLGILSFADRTQGRSPRRHWGSAVVRRGSHAELLAEAMWRDHRWGRLGQAEQMLVA